MRGGWTRGVPANSAPGASRLTAAVIFDDPIDLLLDLAERQRLDPSRISLVALVDHFAVACAQSAPHVLIERRTDWLAMATGLVLPRSRLLCPATQKAATEAEHRPHGKSRASLRASSARPRSLLQARPQLSHEVFARSRPGPDSQVASYLALMEACLTVLRGRDGVPAETRSTGRRSLTCFASPRPCFACAHSRRQ